MKFQVGITLSFCLMILGSDLFAQNDYSILYLRNGGVYIGEILDDQSQNVEMRLADGNEISFPKDNVKRHLESRRVVVYPDGKFNVTRGFFFQIGLGMNLESFGQDEDEAQISSHQTYLFGTYLNPKLALGGGFGFEFNEAELSGFEFDTQVLSQFLYARYYPFNTKRRPFVFTRFGYGARADDSEFGGDNGGGYNFQGGAGIHFSSRKKSKFVLSVGYHLQKTNGTERFIDERGSEIFTTYDILIRRMIISFAIEFNKVPRRYRGMR